MLNMIMQHNQEEKEKKREPSENILEKKHARQEKGEKIKNLAAKLKNKITL